MISLMLVVAVTISVVSGEYIMRRDQSGSQVTDRKGPVVPLHWKQNNEAAAAVKKQWEVKKAMQRKLVDEEKVEARTQGRHEEAQQQTETKETASGEKSSSGSLAEGPSAGAHILNNAIHFKVNNDNAQAESDHLEQVWQQHQKAKAEEVEKMKEHQEEIDPGPIDGDTHGRLTSDTPVIDDTENKPSEGWQGNHDDESETGNDASLAQAGTAKKWITSSTEETGIDDDMLQKPSPLAEAWTRRYGDASSDGDVPSAGQAPSPMHPFNSDDWMAAMSDGRIAKAKAKSDPSVVPQGDDLKLASEVAPSITDAPTESPVDKAIRSHISIPTPSMAPSPSPIPNW
jgi:hypothetical protein